MDMQGSMSERSAFLICLLSRRHARRHLIWINKIRVAHVTGIEIAASI